MSAPLVAATGCFSRIALFTLVLSFIGLSAHAQSSAVGSISVVARMPGTVSLSQTNFPFVLSVTQGRSTTAEAAFTFRWNLNPSENQAFRVIASVHYVDVHPSQPSPTAHALQIRMNSGEFRQPSRPNGQLVLLVRRVTQDNRMGNEAATLEIKIDDDDASSLPDGNYQGVLSLTAQPL